MARTQKGPTAPSGEHVVLAARASSGCGRSIRRCRDLFAFAPFSRVNVMVDGQPEITATAQLVSGTLPRRPRRVARARPAVDARRRSGRRRAGRGHLVSLLAAAIRGVPGVLGRTVARQPCSDHDRRRDGRRVQRRDAGWRVTRHLGAARPLPAVPAESRRPRQPSYWWIRVMGRLAPRRDRAQAAASLEPVFQQAAREGWVAGSARLRTPPDEVMPDMPTLAADPGARARTTPDGSTPGLADADGSRRPACWRLRARTSRTCCWPAERRAAARSRSGWPSAPAAAAIVRQLLAESLLLASAGAALGMALAWWGRGLLLALRPFGNTAVVLDLPLDARVLGFTVSVTVGTALLFGLSPALRATSVDLNAQFQSGARTLGGGGRSRLSQALMVVQIALSLVLLVSTGLFVRTLDNLQQMDAGFNRHGLVLFRIDASSAGYTRDRFTPLQARLQESIARLPGVRAATFSKYGAAVACAPEQADLGVRPHTAVRHVADRQHQRARVRTSSRRWSCRSCSGGASRNGDDETAPKRGGGQSGVRADVFRRRTARSASPSSSAGYADRVEIIGVAGGCQVHGPARRGASDRVSSPLAAGGRRCELRSPARGSEPDRSRVLLQPFGRRCARSTRRYPC